MRRKRCLKDGIQIDGLCGDPSWQMHNVGLSVLELACGSLKQAACWLVMSLSGPLRIRDQETHQGERGRDIESAR